MGVSHEEPRHAESYVGLVDARELHCWVVSHEFPMGFPCGSHGLWHSH